MTASSAAQNLTALLTTASRTGWMSVGELAMTRRISPVAVCCSSDSVTCAWASMTTRFFSCSSVNSRTFSMAITAWSANVWRSAICLAVNGWTTSRRITMAPSDAPSRKSGATRLVRLRRPVRRTPRPRLGVLGLGKRLQVVDMNRPPVTHGPAGDSGRRGGERCPEPPLTADVPRGLPPREAHRLPRGRCANPWRRTLERRSRPRRRAPAGGRWASG